MEMDGNDVSRARIPSHRERFHCCRNKHGITATDRGTKGYRVENTETNST